MCNQRPKRLNLRMMEEMSMNEASSNHIADHSKYEEVNGQNEGEEGEEERLHVEEEAAARFWNVLQSELNVEIPSYVKNIMRMCHLDKALSFRCIRDETIAELEKFVRKSMMYQLMGIEANLEDYYGPFHKMPHKFRFAIGDRFLIKQLVACAKSKSDDYWKRVLSPTCRQHQSGIAATTTMTTTMTTTSPTTRSIRSIRYHRQTRSSANELQEEEEQQQQQQQQDDATSELEEEEDRPQDEAPLNLDQERRKLVEIVRSSLLKEDYGEGVDAKQVAGRVKVRVTVKTSDEYGGAQRDIVTGFIKCVFCPTRLMIRKQAFGARKPRWVISNYRRHIRFHLDGKLRRPSPRDFASPRQQQTTQQVPCKPEFFAVDVDSELHADEQTDDQIATEMEAAYEEQEDQ